MENSSELLVSRKKRKEEGRRMKRQRIQESGGVRPRKGNNETHSENAPSPSEAREKHQIRSAFPTKKVRSNKKKKVPAPLGEGHRFGRVMQNVPCRETPRFSTLSIALPGSVLTNCQTKELRTLLVGQIARAATIYHADEIIVFDDKLGRTKNEMHSGWRRHNNKREYDNDNHTQKNDHRRINKEGDNYDEANKKGVNEEGKERRPRSNPQEFMARLLQYCECPQYLRRHYFPMHPDLQFAGLLAPVDAPHHVRAEDHSLYREGVVLDKLSSITGSGSLVNCGIRNRPVHIDRKLQSGIRCTVQIDPSQYRQTGPIRGTVVSPAAPREANGTYWGYTTRMASSINAVFDECPYEGGYDLKIGTSERGDRSVEDNNFKVPKFEHSLVVFGGVAGIEECVDADESIKLPGSQSKRLFDIWLNTCPFQGSRTVRTEEAVLISLATLGPALANSSRTTSERLVVGKANKEDEETEETQNVEDCVSDDGSVLSEESSSSSSSEEGSDGSDGSTGEG